MMYEDPYFRLQFLDPVDYQLLGVVKSKLDPKSDVKEIGAKMEREILETFIPLH